MPRASSAGPGGRRGFSAADVQKQLGNVLKTAPPSIRESFDARLNKNVKEKKAAAAKQQRQAAKMIQDIQARGRAKSATDWTKFRADLDKNQLGGGLSFAERARQGAEKKSKEFAKAAAEQERAYQKKIYNFQSSLKDRPLNMEGFEAVHGWTPPE
jgi:hypothetical protein